MDSIIRPVVTPERYRELEIIAMQMVMQFPHQDLGECMVVNDLIDDALRRWIHSERKAQEEAAARKVLTLVSGTGGGISRWKPDSA